MDLSSRNQLDKSGHDLHFEPNIDDGSALAFDLAAALRPGGSATRRLSLRGLGARKDLSSDKLTAIANSIAAEQAYSSNRWRSTTQWREDLACHASESDDKVIALFVDGCELTAPKGIWFDIASYGRPGVVDRMMAMYVDLLPRSRPDFDKHMVGSNDQFRGRFPMLELRFHVVWSAGSAPYPCLATYVAGTDIMVDVWSSLRGASNYHTQILSHW